METIFTAYLIGMFVGLITGVAGTLFFFGNKEGNRQDYIIKIASLKRDKAIVAEEKRTLVERVEQLERYLEMSNEEARDNKDLMLVYSRELELEKDKNRQLMKEISGIRSGMKLMRRAN